MSDLRIERRGRVLVFTVDRPKASNALAPGTMAELDRALRGLAEDEEVGCAVVTGAGDRAFIAGGDLKELESQRGEEFARRMAEGMRATLDLIAELPVPVLAAVNGAAIGGGAEVAIACDFRIAVDEARIGFTQSLLGLMPAWGGIERLAAATGRGRALYLLTTGRTLLGSEAERWGLVEESVPRERFDARWQELAEQIAAAPSHVLAGLKRCVNAAEPGNRPDLAASAIADFARSWAHDDHWRMAGDAERRRREVRQRRSTRA